MADDDPLNSHDREVLRAEIERLEAKKRELEGDVRYHAVELSDLESDKDGLIKHKAQQRTFRRTVTIIAPIVLLLGGGVVTAIFVRYLEEETFQGQVVRAEGESPSDVGDRCAMRIEPAFFPFNAQIFVNCADQRLYGYGSSGYAQCETANSVAVKCDDAGPIEYDGDPYIEFDRSTGIFHIDDASHWQMDIELSGLGDGG